VSNARHPFVWVAMATILPGLGGGDAAAAPPRSQRVADRIAERAYARQSIAEARAARAEARVAEIAAFAPVPPPPRPATVRRMARAGVPLGGPVVAPLVITQAAPATAATSTMSAAPAPPTTPAMPSVPVPKAALDAVAEDGTRSVLATAEAPATQSATREPAGAAVTHPPIELLPTPQPQ